MYMYTQQKMDTVDLQYGFESLLYESYQSFICYRNQIGKTKSKFETNRVL